MTTQTTRPERAIGQTWRTNGEAEIKYTITGGNARDGWACCKEGDVDKTDGWIHNGACCWFADAWFEYATYLGPTEPGEGEAPRPAKGQRWRDAMPGYDRTWTVTGPHDTRGWRVVDNSNGYETWWENSDFENGALAFVDHGEPASPPSQPRTGPATDSEQPTTRALDPAVPRKPAARPPAGVDGQCRPSNPASNHQRKERHDEMGTAAKAGSGEAQEGGTGKARRPQGHGEAAQQASGEREGAHDVAEDSGERHAEVPGRAGGRSGDALSARAILQAKERARQAKREEDARAVAAFCDDFDLLPDAP